MLDYKEIRHLHIELSSICNARCPLCPRNLYGYPINLGYKETSLPLNIIKKSLDKNFLNQINSILINGNFGDFVSNSESVEIIKYLRSSNPKTEIVVSTNGSARDENFWKELGQLDITIEFCLDGLEDTHHLYRQDTSWHKIIKNAEAFMKAGGKACWKMIKFKHNEHQIDDCKSLSEKLGFNSFVLVDEGRNTGPVFDRKGNLSHIIGDYQGPTDLNSFLSNESALPNLPISNKINCGNELLTFSVASYPSTDDIVIYPSDLQIDSITFLFTGLSSTIKIVLLVILILFP